MRAICLFIAFFLIGKVTCGQDLEVTGKIKSKTIDPTGLTNPIVKINPDGTLAAASANDYQFEPYIKCPGDTLYISTNKYLIVPGLCAANPTPLSVQARLDTAETPFQIYQSNNLLLDSLYGKTYEGGLIFYLNTTTGAGMVCTDNDILNQAGASSHWGYWNFMGSLTGVSTTSNIGTGQANTTNIMTKYNSESFTFINDFAAKNCNDLIINGKSDWYLPSNDELIELFNNLYNNPIVTSGNFNQSQYGVVYWSSTIGPGGFYGHRFGEVLPFPGAMRIEVAADFHHFPPTELNTPSLKVRAVRSF
jgi:hypothetical protein